MNTTVADSPSSGSHGVYVLFTLVVATSVTNMILSVPLNGYIIWLILGSSRETMATDFFSLNLALSEFLFAFCGIWFPLFVYLNSTTSEKIFFFFLGFLFTARPLFQCCICVEYYVGVIHPVLYLQVKPLRYRVACCCVLWLLNLLSCIYNFYTFEISMYLYVYFIQTLLFLFVMLFCCLSVLWALKRPGPGDGVTGKRTSNSTKRRAFKIISIILTFMTINLFSYMVAIPLQCCISQALFYTSLSCFLSVAVITGFIQPIFYLHRSGKLPSFSKVKSPQQSVMPSSLKSITKKGG